MVIYNGALARQLEHLHAVKLGFLCITLLLPKTRDLTQYIKFAHRHTQCHHSTSMHKLEQEQRTSATEVMLQLHMVHLFMLRNLADVSDLMVLAGGS